MPEPLSVSKIPTWSVRFESYDDFLVEYTDHLRRNLLVLPLGRELAPGTAVRAKLHLPDGRLVYLDGVVASADDCEVELKEGEVLVAIADLSQEQRATFERCLQRMTLEEGEGDPGTEASRLNVLLVDDLVSVRLEIGDALRAHGMRVRVAENGLEGLSAALKQPPDVILTDVEMPTVDGWKLLHMVRSRRRLAHVPVVFFTRLEDELSRLRGYRMGVDDYLAKDTLPEEIVARLQGAAKRSVRIRGGKVASQGLRGDLEHVGLGSVLAFLESERRTGELHLTDGNDSAVLRVREGFLEGVDNLGAYQHPHDRVFQLLDWVQGEFEFFAGTESSAGMDEPSPQVTPIGYLLMEHARRSDEANASESAS